MKQNETTIGLMNEGDSPSNHYYFNYCYWDWAGNCWKCYKQNVQSYQDTPSGGCIDGNCYGYYLVNQETPVPEKGTKTIKEPNGKLIAIDLDGTLCRGECWTEEACLHAEPIQEMIDTVNDLYIKGGHIIIYTARPEWFRHETEYWLNKHKVRRHALVMGSNKIGADYYIDDKAIRPEEL